MNRQKELQQQLQDLNKQLSQRKVEIQQEKREKAAAKVNGPEMLLPIGISRISIRWELISCKRWFVLIPQ